MVGTISLVTTANSYLTGAAILAYAFGFVLTLLPTSKFRPSSQM